MFIKQNVFSSMFIVIFIILYIGIPCFGFSVLYVNENVTRIRRQTSCRTGQFRCKTGVCIPEYQKCDGVADCSDGSDEFLNCNPFGCTEYNFQCAYGACVDGDAKCDGRQDCYLDNSDETSCGPTATESNTCGKKFACKSGGCIEQYSLCDGVADCADKSDETFEKCNSLICPENTFRCAYGACVDGDSKCNGRVDCVDESDELSSICGSVTSTTQEPTSSFCTPPIINNGKFTVSDIGYKTGDLIPEKSIITLQCNNGYRLSPSNEILTCISGGHWNKEIPKCESNITPPTNTESCSPFVIENGKYIVGDGISYVPGTPINSFSIITIKCNLNYGLRPPISRLYCIQGKFNTELPQCVMTCPPRISLDADIKCTIDGTKTDCTKKEEMVEGTIAEMKCKPYYTEIGAPSSPYAVCKDGSWDIPIKKCLPVCGDVVNQVTPLIVNPNKEVNIGEFPWHVAVYRQKNSDPEPQYICGGSIISVNAVLSAAHCFTDNKIKHPATEFHIGAGKFYSSYNDTRDESAELLRVKKIEIPPLYAGRDRDFISDIAVVIVENKFTISNLIRPVCVDWDKSQTINSNQEGHIVGWGSSNETQRRKSDELKHLAVPYINTYDCYSHLPNSFSNFIRDDKFCAGFKNGSSVCVGDSGGGLVFKNPGNEKYYVHGIVSLGPTDMKNNKVCENFQVGLYTSVAAYVTNFLKDVEIKNRI